MYIIWCRIIWYGPALTHPALSTPPFNTGDACRSTQGSLLVAHMGAGRTAAVDDLRAAVKRCMNAGWALEAVRRGVASAKQGHHEGALTYYDKVRRAERSIT